jgi:hypothetical protein
LVGAVVGAAGGDRDRDRHAETGLHASDICIHAVLTARLQILMPGGIRVLTIGGQMPIAEHAAAVDAYRHALSTTFLAGAIVAVIACLTVVLSPERPLGAMWRQRCMVA